MSGSRQGRRIRGYPLIAVVSLLASPACADSWNTAGPVELGLNPTAIESFRALCENTGADCCLVAYRGRIVLEWYGPTYREPIYTMSSVKSWTALLVGMLVADGAIADVATPVSHYLPEWTAGAKAGVTVQQLLSMTSGLDSRDAKSGPRRSIGFTSDKNAFVFGLPLDHRPGSRWAYSNEGVQLLSPLIERASGVSPAAYARSRLFRPLGMVSTRLHEYPAGQYGVLWWIHYRRDKPEPRTSFRSQIRRFLGKAPRRPRPYAYSTQGYLNTDCYVIPEDGIVAARMQMRPRSSHGQVYDREEALVYLDGVVDNGPHETETMAGSASGRRSVPGRSSH